MGVSKESSNRLFRKFKVEYEEPEVVAAVVDTPENPATKEQDQAVKDFAQEVLTLLGGFGSITAEYEMLLNVLIKRADMRNIALPVASLAKGNAGLTKAISTLYGKQIDSMPFKQFVDLLKYEYKETTTRVSAGLSLDQLGDVSDAINNSQIQTSPQLHAISVVKDNYQQYLIQTGNEDLLIAKNLIHELGKAGSAISSLNTINTTTDNKAVTDFAKDGPNTTQEEKDKLGKLLEECIPCLDRSLQLSADWKVTNPLKKFLDNLWKQYLAMLKALLLWKLTIADSYFSTEICHIIDFLTSFVCLPDLVGIASMIKMLIYKYKKLFKTELGGLTVGIPSEPYALAFDVSLNALTTLMTQLMNGVFSAVDCVLDSMQMQLQKVNASREVSDILVETGVIDKSFGWDMNLKEMIPAEQELGKLYATLRRGRDSITETVHAYLEELSKKTRLTNKATENMVDIFAQISKFQKYISLILEIIRIAKAFGKMLDKKDWKKLYADICRNGFMDQYPYYDALQPGSDGGPGKGSGPGSGTGGSGGGSGGGTGDNGGSGGSGGSGDSDGGDIVIIIDKSLPKDFFGPSDPIRAFDDPYIRNKYNQLQYDDSPENGTDSLRIDEDLLSRYKAIASRTNVLQDSAQNNSATTITNLPTIFLDLSNCLSLKSIDGVSQNELDSWMNKINS